MMHAMLALAWLVLVPQDKTPAKTLEERLKELEERLGSLEKRHQSLDEENRTLEKRLGDAKAARETFVRQSASAWVKRFAQPAEFTEKQSAEVEELWIGWTRSDLDRPTDAAGWKAREETLKGKLSPEQVSKLQRAVRDEQEKGVKGTVAGLVQMTKISADHAPALEKAVMANVTIPEGAILLQAHPEKQLPWSAAYSAAEKALLELSSTLSEEELGRLRDFFARFKPRK